VSGTATARTVTVEIYHAPDVASLCEEEGQRRLHSFNSRHASHQPTRVLLRRAADPGTAEQAAGRHRFILSYFEHGTCLWMLADEPRGLLADDWYWDGQDVAGVLTWDHPVAELGPRSLEDRRAAARLFLETYTAWCNGETYGYEVLDEQGDPVARCGFLIGLDRTLEDLFASLDGCDEIVAVTARACALDLDDVRSAWENLSPC
jgi:hypothetical protein